MDAAAHDYADARDMMVDGQVRPNKVNDPRILGAMCRIPRELFLPAALAPLAYVDAPVRLPNGRALMEPMVIARLIQLAGPVGGERALVVAAGAGYGAALLAACGVRVTALEDDPALLALSGPALAATAPNVDVVSGPLAEGWRPGAPFDVILIDGAVRAIPPAIAAQLRQEAGRLVTVLAPEHGHASGVLAEATAAGIRPRAMFDCASPLIPSLLPKPGFVF